MNTIEYLKHGNPFSYIQRMISEAQNMTRFARKPSYEDALKQAGERVEKERKDYLTTSNDNTWVEKRNDKQKNKHLEKRGIKGAKSHHLWEEEHPVLNAVGTAAGAAPLAVAAYPFVAGAGELAYGLGTKAAATTVGQTLLAGTLGGEAWEALNHGITGQSWGDNLGDVIGLDKDNYLGRTALGLTNPFYFTSPNMIYKGGEAVMNAGKTALNLTKPQITIDYVANTTPEISKTAINNSQKIPALSQEEINKAFEQARNWHINRISSPSYRSKALRAGFTEEEIPQLRQQLISQIKRLKLLNPKEFLGKNVSARHNFNGKTNAGYWKGLDNKGYLLQGIEFTNPNMSYDDAVSTFVHEFGHGATFGLNGTETSGYMKDLADQFPLINRLVKYNRTLYPEISARRVELAVPGATRTGNINYYASPTEMQSRGYEFIRDYGINWTKANRAGRLSSTTHKDLVGNRGNSNIFNTIATPKGAINFLKNALGISIPIGIGYDLYNNQSQNEIR